MARIPLIDKSGANEEVLHFYARIADWLKPLPGKRAEQSEALPPQPWRALAHSPELATIIFEGSSYIFSQMPWAVQHARERQLVILTVIRRLQCEFAYIGHWPTSEKAGISREIYDKFATIKGLEEIKSSQILSNIEIILIAYADSLASTGKVDATLFDKIVDAYGTQGAVEITAVVGYRALTSILINAFDLTDD